MPARKFHAQTAYLEIARKLKTTSPTAISQEIAKQYKIHYRPQAITQFFKRARLRGDDIEARLNAEFQEKAVTTAESFIDRTATEKLFQSDVYESIDSVKKYRLAKTGKISKNLLEGNLQAIKRICQGFFFIKYRFYDETRKVYTKKMERVDIPNWQTIHPDRLELEDFQRFIIKVQEAKEEQAAKLGKPTAGLALTGTKSYRSPFRDFMQYGRGIAIGKEVSGEAGKIGKWKTVYVEKDVLDKIQAWIKTQDLTAYIVNRFAFKTGTRIEATLESTRKSNLRKEGAINLMHVIDKGKHQKGRLEWDKIVPADLFEELSYLWRENEQKADEYLRTTQEPDQTKRMRTFNEIKDKAFYFIESEQVNLVNKKAYQLFLEKQDPVSFDLAIEEPSHFWRHMFAQHMLRATNWNYQAVAWLGGWQELSMLTRVYGAPAKDILIKLGLETIPTI